MPAFLSPQPQAVPHRRLALILGFLIAVGPVSVDMYLPAFAEIGDEFGPAASGLTLAAYFVGFAAGQLGFGIAADSFGRRRPFALGLAIYIAGSLGCAVAFDTTTFCLCRAIAAFGAAASIVIPRAYVRDVADGAAAGALMSEVLAVMSVAPIVAPLIGGALLLITTWRGIFAVAAGYGFASLLLQCQLQETLPVERRTALSVPTVLRRYRDILEDGQFLTYAIIGSFGMAALFAYLAGSPTVFEVEFHYTAWEYGIVASLIGAATIAFFRLNTMLVRARGVRPIIGLGVFIWTIAGLGLALSAWAAPLGATAIFIGLVAFSLGYSFIPSNSQVAALARHPDRAATATSLMSAFQYFYGAIAGGAVGFWADGTAKPMAAIILACGLGAAAVLHFGRSASGNR